MIKLLDDPKLIERLCNAEPYIGCFFMASAVAFHDAPDLMTVWAEVDEHGRAVSAVNIGSSELMVLTGGNNHHMIEAMFKAFAKALDQATVIDPRITDILSTKGSL